MAVYPFYAKIDSSTRRTMCGCGTRAKDGTQVIHVFQRSEGSITEPYTINQRSVFRDGKHYLVTDVVYFGKVIHSHETEY